ncbi:MAG: T9SS type A sorting domain-containing protein [Candidatus Cloacimonetes bacterium]|nr:T9SS type A sorting domain-containing protein [Candidatus Cloacimonadota bacterium]
MKRIFILLVLSLFVCTLLANDLMQPAQIAKGGYYQGMRFGYRSAFRDQDPAPEYFFIQNGNSENTTYLIDSYYDYMPFSYNGHNLRFQPEISMPYGYPADGMFVSYMCSETSVPDIDRRAFYSYLNPDGTLYYSGASNVYTIDREGFTGIAIDPVTGDPFIIWHSVVEPDNSYDSSITYELYHASGSPSNWIEPFIIFDNPEMSAPLTGHADDEFIWPQVWIGPSPLAGHRRVHAYGNNYTGSNYNSLYGYADFNADSLLYSAHLDWTMKTFEYFDYMHYNDIDRVNKDLIVSKVDGKVAFFGSAGDSLMAMYSDDYGDTFTKYTQQLKQPMDNPTNQNPPYAPLWENDDGSAAEMFILPSNDMSHYNGVFTDNNTKIQWMTGVNYNSAENISQGVYWPAYMYPKIFTFDTVTGEFSFYDLDVQDTDPGDDHLAVAFDLNDDGIVDEYDDEGWPIVVMSCPSWFFNTEGGWQDAYFHESICKMVANENWVVCVWHDSAKLQAAFYEEPGYDGWVKESEFCIIISDDNGETWSDIRYFNANPNDNIIDPVNHYDGNYAPELEDMIAVDACLGDKLEILSNTSGNYHAKLHFVFMDDNDYGSAAVATPGGGTINGSSLRYAALDLEFQEPNTTSIHENTITPVAGHLSQNYPNPFNPSTTIAYNMIEAGKVSIEVFNIKGQKVKTLINEQMTAGNHDVTWDGKDTNNKSVSSGIYFYKMKTGNYVSTKKMILMK